MPVLLWMGLIFYLSHQDRDSSAELSNWVVSILNIFQLDIELLRAYHIPTLIRKLAHMTEYFVLYLLTIRLIRWYSPDHPRAFLYAFLVCFVYACTDEYHQSFVVGRGASIYDVLIDSSGALLGLGGEQLWRKKKGNVSLQKRSRS